MSPAYGERGHIRAALLIWALAAIVMIAVSWPLVATLGFRDADDAMRMVQVRDWIAGQGWFDVTQHRANPPHGGPMHWSRLVDVPIAAIILALRPLTGTMIAEKVAVAIVPLLLLLPLVPLTGCITRKLTGDRTTAIVAMALLATSLPILIQFTPTRIDHHGWQILMAGVVIGALVDLWPRHAAPVAGVAMALWLHISAEALPYAALVGGLLALRATADRREGALLPGYAATLTLASVALLVGVRGPAVAAQPACDAMSPVYLWPMAATTAALFALRTVMGDATPLRRLAVPAIAAGLGALVFVRSGQSCLSGPFSALDPLVDRFWYQQVLEGRPIWDQRSSSVAIALAPAVLGLAGTLLAWRRAEGRQRARWFALLLFGLGACAVMLMVYRAASVAHLALLPGTARLAWLLFRRARRFHGAVLRIVATLAAMLGTPLGAAGVALALTPSPAADGKTVPSSCPRQADWRILGRMPAALIFAPVDISPEALLRTRDRVIGTGHHRNWRGMRTVIAAFIAPPDEARRQIVATGARYLVLCPDLSEIGNYAKAAPHGLAAQLRAGGRFDWLVPLPAPRGQILRVYRIVDPAGTKRIATPFMQ
jgi:hypothetical protein